MARPGRIGGGLGGPGFDVVERALATVDRHRMTAPGDTVVAAASGGPDSTCLLDVLARASERLEIGVVVVHVDHGLAPGSEVVANDVARAAAEAGFDVHVVRAPELAGPNLQARARAFRYGVLETVARSVGARRIATGHTLDDRVETLLARLVHGAATEGLAGLPPADGARVRPLVDVRRAETRAYCAERGLSFVDDPANDDERFERVRVRRSLVAAVERGWGDGAVRAMARSATRLAEDAAALAELAERIYSEVAADDGDGVRVRRDALDALPRALRRRVLERAVGRVRDRAGGIEAALDALERPDAAGVRFDVAAGAEIAVADDAVVVRRRMA
ncbi:MAG TPA: tRNA lysidine(34) synthetase TilS [Actinomycetota bacterium]|nr:tRNA lysidine(34) synthetase TilS [Actinomycetota bacterium]